MDIGEKLPYNQPLLKSMGITKKTLAHQCK